MPAYLIDQREPEHIKAMTLEPKSVVLLECGDVQIACDDGAIVIVERKTPDDFLNSIADGRIFNQVRGMLKVSQWSYVVICGQFRYDKDGAVITDARQTGWNYASVMGAALSIQEVGAFVTFCRDDADFEKEITRLATRSRDTLHVAPRKIEELGFTNQLLCTLPGIGTERASKLLEWCGGSGAQALAAITQPATNIPGIPSSVIHNARFVLGLDHDQILAINNLTPFTGE
jgi:ERCC4-type nuclease